MSEPLIASIIGTLSQLGLVFLLFLIGIDFEPEHVRLKGAAVVTISCAGIILPFCLGLGLAQVIHPHVTADIPLTGFALFLGTAISITAIPVLGRIMVDLNILRTRLGTVVISAAAVDDAVGWILLASAAACVQARFQPAQALMMAAETIVFAVLMLALVRPIILRWLHRSIAKNGAPGVNTLALLMVLLFVCAIITNRIGIFAVFGAFLFGVALSGDRGCREVVSRGFRDFVTAFFLPLYFAYTGLRTDIGHLGGWSLWLCCAALCLVAITGKLVGCGLAARVTGYSWREAACIGTLMNTRGLMALIVINVGKDLAIIPDSVYCMLVLMALVTTIITTPILMTLMPGTELEAPITASHKKTAMMAEC